MEANGVRRQKKNRRAGTFIVPALLVLSLFLGGCRQQKSNEVGWAQLEGSTMGTTYHITVSDLEDNQANYLVDSVLEIVNRSLSTYDSSSYISKFNTSESGEFAEGKSDIQLRQIFRKVWDLAYENYLISGGAFDPSASPFFQVWGFAERERRGLPSQQLLDSLSILVDFNSKNFPPYTKLRPEAELNFNAIAKGYGVDLVSETLQRAGAVNGMVEIGGEVRTFGLNKKGRYWRIGISKPDEMEDDNTLIETVELHNRSMATSGNYRNFFYHEGIKYNHTIDPRSGYPIESNLKSATVLSSSCASADALATACMVLGEIEGAEMIENLPDVDAIFIVEIKDLLQIRRLFKSELK